MGPHVSPRTIRFGLRAARPLFASPRLSLAAKRRLVDRLTAVARGPHGTHYRRDELGGVAVERAVPPTAAGAATLLYLHGGGFALGSARAYRGVAAQLAAAAGAVAVVPDYRLAPEHPYPAALDDALAVYRALIDTGVAPEDIVLAGDSAGGGLALALLVALRAHHLPQPAAAGLICPWLDLEVDVNGGRPPGRDPLITAALIAEWATPYVGDAAPRDPGISPLHGDLGGLAPIVVHSAGDDPLAVDAERLDAAFAVRTDVGTLEHRRYPGRWHDFHLQVGVLPDAGVALAELGGRLRHHLTCRPSLVRA